MDTITHGVAGALLAKSISDGPSRKQLRLAVILGSVAPDLDLLGGLFASDDLFDLEFHRGITHSIVALPVLAILLAVLTPRKTEKLKLLALGYGLGLASHIFLDVVTAYGTMIFEPFSNTRYTLDTIFIIDLTLGSLVLIPQLVAFAWSDPKQGPRRAWVFWLFSLTGVVVAFFFVNGLGVHLSFGASIVAVCIFGIAFALPGVTRAGSRWRPSRYCRIGLALSVCYVVACSIAHRKAVERVHHLAEKYQLQAIRAAALPAPPSLLQWTGLVQTADGITRFPITLGTEEASAERFVNAYPLPHEDELRSLPQLQTFLWFARFPWITAREDNQKQIVEYQDLQFLRPDSRDNTPFTFQVQFNAQGKLLAARLLKRMDISKQ